MVGMIEMANFEGVCKYCGNMQPILAADQIDANLKISETCKCKGYLKEKQHDRMLKNIDQTFGAECQQFGLLPVSTGQLAAITDAAELVFKETIQMTAIGLFGSTAKISKSAKGAIKIERTFSTKVQTEA